MKKGKYLVHVFCLMVLIPALSSVAYPQAKYPAKPIDIIVPYAPGGATDLVARAIANSLKRKWRVPVNVINKPGGNTLPACVDVFNSSPDGYTLLTDNQASSSMIGIVVKNLPFKVTDRTFIATAAITPNFLISASSSTFKTLKDIIEEAKRDPGSFTWTSIGGASPQDFTIRQFLKAIGVDVLKTKPIMVQGAAPAVSLTGGGHVKLGCGATSSAMPGIQGGTVRPLAYTWKERHPELPSVPTTAELGYPTVNCVYWVGISGPAKLPPQISQIWNDAIKALMNDTEFLTSLKNVKAMPFYRDSQQTRDHVIQETKEVEELWR